MALKFKWNLIEIEGKKEYHEIVELLKQNRPEIISLDTETTGLDLMHDRAFYLTFAFVVESKGYSVGVDLTRTVRSIVLSLLTLIDEATSKGLLIGHNLPFDLAMLTHIPFKFSHENFADTMTMIRLATDALPVDKGGAPIGLKDFATQYIYQGSNYYDKLIRKSQSEIVKELNRKLYQQGLKKKYIDELLNDIPNDASDLPEDIRNIYTTWYDQLPKRIRRNMKGNSVVIDDVPYHMLPRDLLAKYAMYDTALVIEIFVELEPIITIRQQSETFKQENELIVPLTDMSMIGFEINKPYVEESRKRLKEYIIGVKQEMYTLAGKVFKPSSHLQIKDIYERMGLERPASTNDEFLQNILLNESSYRPEIIRFTELLSEYRTLVKGYKNYLTRFYNTMQYSNYIYTSLNPAGTVTGRFTSDFQQFPKFPIYYRGTKEELFWPRRMVKVPEGYTLVFIDYSQIELRLQALYTMLLDKPDLNLCRAYLPYLCYHYETKEEYDWKNVESTKRWNEKQPNGKSVWLLRETGVPWEPTDVHSTTAHAAYPEVPMDSPEFKELRQMGKRTNFGKLYGISLGGLLEQFKDKERETVIRINEGFNKAYGGIVEYQKWCKSLIHHQGYGENLFNRKYYNISGHNFINAAIQGSAADMLKIKMIELHKFLKQNSTKSKMMMSIHDEVVFMVADEEMDLVPKLVEIMENLPGTLVPIVAEVETTKTTWAEKK